jgi:hypothetical protein
MIRLSIRETSPRWSLSWWLFRAGCAFFTSGVSMALALWYRLGSRPVEEPWLSLTLASAGAGTAALVLYVLRESRKRDDARP